ncbi:hypothetical protein U9M48_032803 [Paspalum notatum var. saurae]|uniref:Uncharacterized protein n=1 Tax=Paspalum notatum var. saurae TaxID=547442 RepID=A0AAQ3X4X3_PASNO
MVCSPRPDGEAERHGLGMNFAARDEGGRQREEPPREQLVLAEEDVSIIASARSARGPFGLGVGSMRAGPSPAGQKAAAGSGLESAMAAPIR